MGGITDPTEAYFKDGTWGWDGTQWRKLALVFGYSDRYAEYEESLNVAAGHQTLTFSTVPAGEVWVIESYSAWASTTNPAFVQLQATLGGVSHRFVTRAYATAWLTVEMGTPLVLKEDDKLVARFANCILNDDIYAVANGYKMKVAE